ncbi:MAG: Bax inhibitor-1/YccA family protein [Synergistaceae bacterium]|nr:Bax inhibitor-1/YccA family protein [Synergistaceae bacterium]
MSEFNMSYSMPNTGLNLEQVNAIFRKVYMYMAIGLIITAVTAYATASSAQLVKIFYSSRVPMAIVAIVEVGLVLALGFMIHKLSVRAAVLLFALYSLLNGVLFSSVLLVYTQASVYKAFISTAGMFGAMSIYGLYTNKDLTSMGSFLRMGLWGIIIAMLVNLFMGSSSLDLVISIFAVFIFMGLTAFDTWKIKQLAADIDTADEDLTGRVAVIGALSLYLDFVNMFLHLLRLFGKEK